MANITEKMLKTIRNGVDEVNSKKELPGIVTEEIKEPDNFLTRAKILMEEAEKKTFNDDTHGKSFPITKNTPQFGDVRVSQEEAIIKTVGEQVKLNDESLLYYPDADDLVINGELPTLSTTFQFRYNDASGQGIYIWSNGLQMTEENYRTLGKLRDAFVNWKNGLIQDSDLLVKLKKVCERNNV